MKKFLGILVLVLSMCIIGGGTIGCGKKDAPPAGGPGGMGGMY